MIKAVNDKVVGIMLGKKKSAGGIILPDTYKEPQAFCRVLSVGDNVTSIKEGDVIVSHIRGGMDVVIDKEIIKVLKEDEIYGILTHEETLGLLQDIELTKSEPTSKLVTPNRQIIS